MRIARATFFNLSEKRVLNRLDKKITKIQNEILDFEVKAIKTIYKIEIDKTNYKKYKLG